MKHRSASEQEIHIAVAALLRAAAHPDVPWTHFLLVLVRLGFLRGDRIDLRRFLPDGFDGLSREWGTSNYVNPPFGSIVHFGKKKGMTAWVRKALLERDKGKRVVMVYPLDKWVLMLLTAGAQVRNLGDVKWLATEDGSARKGTGRHIACFILEPPA